MNIKIKSKSERQKEIENERRQGTEKGEIKKWDRQNKMTDAKILVIFKLIKFLN